MQAYFSPVDDAILVGDHIMHSAMKMVYYVQSIGTHCHLDERDSICVPAINASFTMLVCETHHAELLHIYDKMWGFSAFPVCRASASHPHRINLTPFGHQWSSARNRLSYCSGM